MILCGGGVRESPQWFPPPGGTSDGGHGPQTSTGWYMGVPNHWDGAVNGGAGREWGAYRPPPEHGRTIHRNSSYHGLVSGGGAEAGTATIQAMVVAACSGYRRDKSGACSSGGGGGGQVWMNQREREREREMESRIGTDGGSETEMTRRTRYDQTDI